MASITDFLTRDSEGHQDQDLGIRLHRVTHTAKVKEHEAFTDGSYYPESKLCGAAVVLPNGQAILTRVPGYASIFKADLVAICIAAKYLPPKSVIYTDSLGSKTCLAGTRERVTCARWVRMARTLTKAKGHRVEHVPAHTGVAGNEMADKKAKDAARLRPQEAQQPRACGDLTFEGELCLFPNKT